MRPSPGHRIPPQLLPTHEAEALRPLLEHLPSSPLREVLMASIHLETALREVLMASIHLETAVLQAFQLAAAHHRIAVQLLVEDAGRADAPSQAGPGASARGGKEDVSG